jgi:hypothetical protein
MTPAQKIEKLQALLERIRQNGARPRPQLVVAGRTAEPPSAEVEPEEDLMPPAPAEAPAVEMVAASPAAEDAESLDDQDVSVDVELLDEDIVDITDLAPDEVESAEARASTEVDIDVEPPSSSRRPKAAAATMDEALAAAAASVEEEAPLKTPPPESGRQVASLAPGRQLQQPPLPSDLTNDLVAVAAPSVEQVGQTVELAERPGPALELAVEPPVAPKPAPRAPEPLEEKLEFVPPPAAPPAEKVAVQPAPPAEKVAVPSAPPVARAVPSAPPVARMPTKPPATKPAPVSEAPAAPLPELTAEVVARPAPPPLVKFIGGAQRFKPQSFAELLDASLGL